MEPTSSASIARQTWELENNIPAAATDPDAMDAIYRYDDAAQARAQQEKPWANDPHHFRRAKISALALLKMVVHARAGGTIEVMGLMQGKCEGDSIIVMDAFALPVEGTETRVNAQADAYEYMVEYSTINKQVSPPHFFCYPLCYVSAFVKILLRLGQCGLSDLLVYMKLIDLEFQHLLICYFSALLAPCCLCNFHSCVFFVDCLGV